MLSKDGYTILAVAALGTAGVLAILGKPFDQTIAFIAITTTLIGRGK